MLNTTVRFTFFMAIVSFAIVFSNTSTTKAYILDFTFENDSLGTIPEGWSAGGYDGNSVTAYVTDTTAGAGTKSFCMNDWAGASQLVLFTSFASQSSGLYQMTGMALVEQINQNLAPFTLIGFGDSRFNNLEFWTDGTFHYEDGHGNWVSSGVAYQSGQWYNFNYLIDMDSDRWSFDIHDSFGNDVLSANNLHFGTNLYTSYFNLLRSWGVGSAYTGVWYIDDVRLEQIPEPSTFVLIATGMATLLVMAWRQRKRK